MAHFNIHCNRIAPTILTMSNPGGGNGNGNKSILPKSTSDVIDEALAAGIFKDNEASLLKTVWAQVKVYIDIYCL